MKLDKKQWEGIIEYVVSFAGALFLFLQQQFDIVIDSSALAVIANGLALVAIAYGIYHNKYVLPKFNEEYKKLKSKE